ncbi:relaxase/mobilization nuclease domain-containing protein [Actinokineospora enzanensis]|uniref:relaxase/mobilization nuclease domain-containing protein n=1 Tax=Actinokineospora enzanensis TaxID=155975 RepID=UPI0012EB6728|nr:hypothetical protein [Actinokineospora enzanensis]
MKEAPRGSNTVGLLQYLYGPGKGEERGGTVHVDPRTIASWDRLHGVHKPVRLANGGQSVRDMAKVIDLPARLAGRSTTNRTGHIVIANHRDDPFLTDTQWAEIADAVMRRAGLWTGPDDASAVRWLATRHDDTSIHITYSRVREDGTDVGYINYTAAWQELRHEFEQQLGLTPTGSADGTSRRPYGQAEASRAKVERHQPGGDPQAQPDTAQLRHWCTVIAVEAEHESAFVVRLRDAGITVAEHQDDHGGIVDYRVGIRTDSAGSPVLYQLSKLAPDLRLDLLRANWQETDSSARTAGLDTVLAHVEGVAATAPEAVSGDEFAAVAQGARELLHATAAYVDLASARAAAEAAERASRLAGYAPIIPSTGGGPVAQMARDLRTSAGILLRSNTGEHDRRDDAAARIVIAVASVLVQIEAWHELADRRAAANAALNAREHLLTARQALMDETRPTPDAFRPGRGGTTRRVDTSTPQPQDGYRRR